MKKEKLVIIGAGNVGGYLAYNIRDFGNFTLLGFLDDDIQKQGTLIYGQPVLGGIEWLANFMVDGPLSVVIGIADPQTRQRIADSLPQHALRLPNFIAKTAWLSPNVVLGKGIIIYPGVCINYGCTLEDFTIVNMNCAIGHNCTLSACTTLAPGVNLGGFTFIDEAVDVGIGVCTRQRTYIGKASQVGGQAMVAKNIPSGVKVKGVPARIYESRLPYLKPKIDASALTSLTINQHPL